MGQKNSKDELVYQQVLEANVEGIKTLCREGVSLEWIDKEGKTPLIVASMDHRLYHVANTLIQMGANVNAYRPGCHAGTPLHHASKRGLDHTVKLLLSHGANPFLRNDDCLTPLDMARTKGYSNVVRAIEAQICLFKGDVREILVAPGILEPFVPQRLSRKRSKMSYVVIVPCSLPNSSGPTKLQLAVYSSQQDPQPCTLIALWKCNIAEPKFLDRDPTLIILDESTGTRHKFLSAIEGDKQQLNQLYCACKGFPQVMAPPQLDNNGVSSSSVEAHTEAVDLDMALGAAIQSAANNQPTAAANATNGWCDDVDTGSRGGWGSSSRLHPAKNNSCSDWADEPPKDIYNGWAVSESTPTSSQCEQGGSQENGASSVSVTQSTHLPAPVSFAPSAPPLPDDILDNCPIRYPTIDVSSVDFSAQAAKEEPCSGSEGKDKADSSSCVICWEAPVEGACIPCGHMAGCMSCLTEIKSKKKECPVCRAKIEKVLKLYAV